MPRSGIEPPTRGFSSDFRYVVDTIDNIENVVGNSTADRLFGDNSSNELSGRQGADTLDGRGGNDTLIGGSGGDTMDGGDDIDTAVYEGFSGINVSLRTGTGFGGDAEGDTLINIENVIAGNGDDIIEGDALVNELSGGGGEHVLSGGGGSDVLTGGADADTFIFDLDYFGSDDAAITDFEAGVDRIDLSGLDYVAGAAEVSEHLDQVGSDVVFSYGQSSITLQNTQLTSLTDGDFLF